jgi:hypothetical protein
MPAMLLSTMCHGRLGPDRGHGATATRYHDDWRALMQFRARRDCNGAQDATNAGVQNDNVARLGKRATLI